MRWKWEDMNDEFYANFLPPEYNTFQTPTKSTILLSLLIGHHCVFLEILFF